MTCELHDYKNIRDDAEVKIDVCCQCKKKLVTQKDKCGRIDNKIYLKEHRREFLQKNNPLYKKYYGELRKR